ncbi:MULTISPECIES: DUF1654 domain-containing protein [unclassified Pseudomonas]|uniref:DUF1654 domain-containing protein n=1 Tax=unclassified Pseudomonas TaxID=196821 RepID=UPI0025E9F68A|nr:MULTISPECIES: DUF1654 domain-containing protein [unclassified Pseudomonas]
MTALQREKQEQRVQVSGVERLNLRIASMINHPIAQLQRWVTIHRLDTDGDREWDEVMGMLAETVGLHMTYNDADGSVTVRWERSDVDEQPEEIGDVFAHEPPAPF